jgi:NADPH2:quinone reductase
MQRVRAIRFSRTGGPEVLTWDEVSLGSPAAGQVHVKHTAVGLNFIDIYHRTGLYPVQPLPSGIGLEAAGVVEAVGDGVTEFAVGDRVAYGTGPIGAYSEIRNIAADKIVKIPDGIEDRTAAAIMLKGLTAQYLLRRTYRVKAGDTILVHAVAGGVGLLLCQWAKRIWAPRSSAQSARLPRSDRARPWLRPHHPLPRHRRGEARARAHGRRRRARSL